MVVNDDTLCFLCIFRKIKKELNRHHIFIGHPPFHECYYICTVHFMFWTQFFLRYVHLFFLWMCDILVIHKK